MPPSSQPSFTSRELTVLIHAGLILMLVPWGWGGVVLWTVCGALGIAFAALLAVTAETLTQRRAILVWAAGLILALVAADREGHAILSYRWLDYVGFPVGALLGSAIAWFLLSRDLRSRPASENRRDLFRLVPFWAGVALFAYFAVQDLNAWGIVVDREAFWARQGLPGIEVGKFDIRPLDYRSWLPSGLTAPFSATDTSQPPMNAWRQMMVLAAPWLLFCALQVGLRRRRGYVILGWVTVLMACVVGAFGFMNQLSSGTILGYPVPYNTTCFGTFMSRNHAGVYLYLHAAVALALTFWHFRRTGDSPLRGGPHLVAAFLAFTLALLTGLTSSVGGALAMFTIMVLSAGGVYFIRTAQQRRQQGASVWLGGGAVLVAGGLIISSIDLAPLFDRVSTKAALYQKVGVDDRAPLRRATWALITDGGWQGRVWVGYGAGSYRWISPPFQALQPEMQRAGRLHHRAVHAHNDWLEMLADWGVIGVLPVLAGLVWLGRRLYRAFRPGHPETIPLALGLLMVGAHASLDLLFWFTPLMCTAAFVAAAMTCLTDASSAEQARDLP